MELLNAMKNGSYHVVTANNVNAQPFSLSPCAHQPAPQALQCQESAS